MKNPVKISRRTFLKMTGMGGLSLTTAACSPEPSKTLYALVEVPDDMVTGKAAWYASTCRECPAGCGIIVKNREGRAIKIEGNPLHPVNRGALCMRGQAALQGVYNPDRIFTPLLKKGNGWQKIGFDRARRILNEKISKAASNDPGRIRILSETVGNCMDGLFAEALSRWNSPGPLYFEPFNYESLKTANNLVFGFKALPSYRMERADLLLSFGADFLETWLSPVEYAHRFKEMHTWREGRKGLFVQISPVQSLTGANADAWLACHPGSEPAVALGLIKEALAVKDKASLPDPLVQALIKISSPYTPEQVCETAGLAGADYDALIRRLKTAKGPLIFGTNSATLSDARLQTDLAVNLLNLILNPTLPLLDFKKRQQVETAAGQSEVYDFFKSLAAKEADVLLLNNANPAYCMPNEPLVAQAFGAEDLFVVSFSNFMDETSRMADLILPVALPLESFDEYSAKAGLLSTLQPTLGRISDAPMLGDLLLKTAFGDSPPAADYAAYVHAHAAASHPISSRDQWLDILEQGGRFEPEKGTAPSSVAFPEPDAFLKSFTEKPITPAPKPVFTPLPSIRFFDGRGANRPWLAEVPDSLTQVAWQSPLLMHPKDLESYGFKEGDVVALESRTGKIEAPVCASNGVQPGLFAMAVGQGHAAFGRYAANQGANPYRLLSPGPEPGTGGPVSVSLIKRTQPLARTSGSRVQYHRKIALSVQTEDLIRPRAAPPKGLTMNDFPLTLPLPEGYDPKRDIFPPHDHKDYRWGMTVDLDRCIGCGACAAACYAENNLGVVGEADIIAGREMAWLQIQRYHSPQNPTQVIFLPMMCQHCDNAPCESVCPVYAPHHSVEGLNNQIYNRCIGTRFCVQNCPYKVRRFNWRVWKWPEPLNMQLNPNVTVRTKGVMEKCSFCIQRIKTAHGVAKDENRNLRDGEVRPACVQTCPTGALTFGNLKDEKSRVREKIRDPRAYQVMGYLNTKPAVIYLKKIRQNI